MFDDVLFPVDESDGATATTGHVLDIADVHDATVHVLNVADTNEVSLTRVQGDVVDALEGEGDRIVREVADRAKQRGIATVTEVLQGDPGRTIVEYANSRSVDLVVMPTHGRQSLERFLLGSTTEWVVRRSAVPVLTIRPGEDSVPGYPYASVLVPTDGSDAARDALELGVDVALVADSPLHVQSVVALQAPGIDSLSDDEVTVLESNAQQLVDDATGFATEEGVTSVSGSVDFGTSVYKEILSYVDEHDVEVVVVGTLGRTGIERYLLGSVAEYLVRTSPVPVLTVREPSGGS